MPGVLDTEIKEMVLVLLEFPSRKISKQIGQAMQSWCDQYCGKEKHKLL